LSFAQNDGGVLEHQYILGARRANLCTLCSEDSTLWKAPKGFSTWSTDATYPWEFAASANERFAFVVRQVI